MDMGDLKPFIKISYPRKFEIYKSKRFLFLVYLFSLVPPIMVARSISGRKKDYIMKKDLIFFNVKKHNLYIYNSKSILG